MKVCPKCGKSLDFEPYIGRYYCTRLGCTYRSKSLYNLPEKEKEQNEHNVVLTLDEMDEIISWLNYLANDTDVVSDEEATDIMKLSTKLCSIVIALSEH